MVTCGWIFGSWDGWKGCDGFDGYICLGGLRCFELVVMVLYGCDGCDGFIWLG